MEKKYKDNLNSSNASSLQLNIQPSLSVVESLNLIDIKNKKIKKPEMKFNTLNNNNNNNKNIIINNESEMNSISSNEEKEINNINNINTNIKHLQKIIFVPTISGIIFIEFILRIFYLINVRDEIEKKYYKYLVFIHVFLIYLSYYFSISTEPSQTNISSKYNLSEESLKKLEHILSKDHWNDYCNYCHSKKFIRSNHCIYCNKCILLKFTHCCFIANCIGFQNVQYVINFLLLIICWLYKFQMSCMKYYTNNFSFILNIFFILNFPLLIISLYFFVKLMFDIYNNQTKYERKKTNNLLDKYYPLYKCNDTDNKFRFPNVFNIGYLSHFYYLIGNSLLHFILPLPKIKNYELNENCPIFKGCKQFDKIEFVNNMSKKNEGYKNSINDRYMEPDNFINFCRQKLNFN